MSLGNLHRSWRATLVVFVALAGMAVLVAGSVAGTSQSPVALGTVKLSPGLESDLAGLPGVTPYGAFVHFSGGDLPEQRDLLDAHGLTIVAKYPQIDVVYAVGTVAEVRSLTREPAIAYLEKNRRLEYAGDTAVWATRSRVAHEDVSGGPYRDGLGRVINGTGVGVAIVDSGILATHPDLTNRVGKNFKIVCTTPALIDTTTEQCFGPIEFIDVGNRGSSDTTSGHGTHVSGIVAGDGTASTGPYAGGGAPNVKGTFTGVAPGATLYGFGTGEAIAVLYATEAFQYIFDNFDQFNPRIRVINNSWGDPAGSVYDPNSVLSKLVKLLVAKDVTFTFSAGNSGGTGQTDRTSSYCKDPTPGVVCVANYDDGSGAVSGTGTREGTLDGDGTVMDADSSRGLKGAPTTYPDVSAPGALITASCIRGVQPVCALGIVNEVRWGGVYASISGTSMASPHTAGVAALLLQARPDLTPPQIEDLLQDTAYKYAYNTVQGPNPVILPGPYESDPQNPGSTIAFDKGAGLVDVPAALTALGVAHDGSASGAAGEPSVRVTEPADGSVSDGTGTIAVAGTASDGTSTSAAPTERTLVAGDGGDFSGPGAADIVSLSVQETAAGVTPGGLTYRMTVRDALDAGPAAVTLRVTQNVDGKPFTTNVSVTAATVVPAGGTAAPTSAQRTGNIISFFVPYANLGNPPAGAPAHNVFASSFINVIVDVAPSAGGAAAADLNGRPMLARPYTILRPQVTAPPAAAVTVSVDGGAEQAATLTGSSPDYAWTAPSIDASALAPGAHTVRARLFLNGAAAPAAEHTVTFFVDRAPPEHTYSVLIVSPADGSEVPRATVQVRGTSSTDDPSTNRAVTLEVHNAGYSSGELPATGTSPWTRDFNFGDLAAGTYTLTARFYVDGVVKATDAVQVTVPEPSGDDVSCAPRSMGFWRQQFDPSGNGSRKFTAGEVDTLAFHAVGLSEQYFETRDELVAALNAKGNAGAELRAARQFAALLMNLAAGDLSRDMSYQVGLSGSERLDPAVYDTARVGSTVDEARAWVRDQLPSGDLGGANEVADAINNGHALLC